MVWQENDFDYVSVDMVKRASAKLEKAGYLLIGNYSKDPGDKTKWHTINDEKLEELYFEVNKKKLEHERKVLEKEIQNTMHNALWQNAPIPTRHLMLFQYNDTMMEIRKYSYTYVYNSKTSRRKTGDF